MAKKQENTWQYKFSFTLSLIMLLLVFGYFSQSFIEIRKVKPVSVAIERISNSQNQSSPIKPKLTSPPEKTKTTTH